MMIDSFWFALLVVLLVVNALDLAVDVSNDRSNDGIRPVSQASADDFEMIFCEVDRHWLCFLIVNKERPSGSRRAGASRADFDTLIYI